MSEIEYIEQMIEIIQERLDQVNEEMNYYTEQLNMLIRLKRRLREKQRKPK